MHKDPLILPCIVISLSVTAAACSVSTATSPPTHNSTTSETVAHATGRTITRTGGIVYTDSRARCHFEVLSSASRIEAKHFPSTLSSDKVRHRITVTPAGDKAVARVDIYDAPRGTTLEQWVHAHLGYLMDGREVISERLMGKKKLRGLLIRRPRSPQSFASRTAVMIAGGRVVVVTGSDVEQPRRLQAFDKVVSSVGLEVTP